ncbi:MAG: DMT family transporter [Burkholderiales bacterium]|nr:DMT family transporter [Burkholderiales bacterium]
MTSGRNWWLFFIPVVVWSTTFYAITLQLASPTTPAYAVAMRFALAAALLFAWLRVHGELQPLGAGAHRWAALSGVCAYGISYVLTYVAEQHIPSGLVAIAFTLMVFMTPALSRVVWRTDVSPRTWVGGGLGVLGVTLCFLPDLLRAELSAAFVPAMLAMMLAAFVSSVAAVCSMQLNRMAVPVTNYTAWAMAYGATATFAYAIVADGTPKLDTRLSFWAAFLYLSLAGTLLAFLCYLTLMKREGAARTMYISVLSPIGAVLVSILFEGLRPQALTITGVLIALAGAWVTLGGKRS